jgi:hypothetical protein
LAALAVVLEPSSSPAARAVTAAAAEKDLSRKRIFGMGVAPVREFA